jgi:O-succinylbenzoic acid--CoA ligase
VTAAWFADERLAELARERGDAPAITDATGVITWSGLDARASAAAALVAREAVAPEARVAVLAEPTADTIASILGVLRAGAIPAPLPAGRTPRELAALSRAVDPALALRAVDLGGRDAAGAPVPRARVRDPEAPAVVVLTSGTTGAPRGAILSHRAMAASADAWLDAMPPATGWVLALGLAHIAGLGIVWRALRDGVPIRIVPRNDAPALLRAIEWDPPSSHVSLVPTQLARLLDVAGPPPRALRALLVGGGPVPPALVVRALRAGWPVVPTYGLTETASAATALPAGEARDHPASAGRPLPGVRLAIDGADPEGIGEIVVTTPARFSGYVGDAAAAVSAGDPVRTGDLGRLDAAGRLFVLDRRLDRIVRGGENVSPGEVEAVLLEHPAIADAAVVARPDTDLGQVPVAAVVLRARAADPGDEALAAHARASLAGFKVPAAWIRLDTLPRAAGGKLRREAVRALAAGEPAGTLERPGGDAIGWRVTGTGDRHVLLLHGTLSTAAQLDRLAQALAGPGDLTVHALDRRGSGSGRLRDPRPLDVATHVADAVAYLDARAIRRTDAVGVSFGGVLALELAARHPGRVDAVVAYEPPYGAVADPPTRAWFERLAGDTATAHRTGGPGRAAETFLRAVAGDAAWDRLPDRARAFLEAEGDGALADAGLTGLDPDGLARIACPVTILTGGASDPFYAPIADALAAGIPGARRATLDGLAHPSPITQPATVAAAARAGLEPIA